MRRRVSITAVTAWLLVLGAVAVWSGALWVDQYSDDVTTTWDKIWGISYLAFPLVGGILASRRPRNAVGWLFIAGSGFVGLGVLLAEMSEAMDRPSLVTSSDNVFGLGLLALFAAFLLFPDGRYPSRWFALAHASAVLALFVEPRLSADSDGAWAMLANLVLALTAMVYRVIRGDATSRRQIAWPVFVSIVGALSMLLAANVVPENSVAVTLAGMVLVPGVPLSIGMAVLKYRLYEIDRIVSRTVTYAAVVGLLGVVFAVGAVWVPSQFAGGQSPVFVAVSTLAAAALFNPLRKRIQHWVERRFNRSRYDAQLIIDDFAGTLRDRVDPAAVVDGWFGVVSKTMHPSLAAVWVRDKS